MKSKKKEKGNFFERLAGKVTLATGSTAAIVIAFGSVILWGVLGPVFHYSENWQLIINTSTTIITFLMVFLIQKSQNKESMAVQLKLNELVAAHEFASNRLVDVENMSEEELIVIRKYYAQLRARSQKDKSLQQSHSIDEAEDKYELKKDIEKDVRKKVGHQKVKAKKPSINKSGGA